jgi:RHS repeat-associated protein
LKVQLINSAGSCYSSDTCVQLSDNGTEAAGMTYSPEVPIAVGQTINASGWVFHSSDSTGYARWVVNIISQNGSTQLQPLADPPIGVWYYDSASYTLPSDYECPCYAQLAIDFSTTQHYGATTNVAIFDNGSITLGGGSVTSSPVYYVEDMLGTSRVLTNNTGVVCYDADFYPYGGERPYTDSCARNVYKFEGKERDAETGNDNFGARSYSNRFGRWLSADWSNIPAPIPYANLSNPQSMNLYTMVGDDPESFADLDGHEVPGGDAYNSAAGQAQWAYINGGDPVAAVNAYLSGAYNTASQAASQSPGRTPKQNPVYEQPNANNQREVELTNIVYNETSGLRVDPNAQPGARGSAEDLQNGRVAIAEVANRVIEGGHPERILAGTDLSSQEVKSINGGNADAINAHNSALAAARQALAGSNTTNGATQYRTRFGRDVSTPVGSSKGHPGTQVSQHFGPFPVGNLRREVIVVAP